jgi:phenylpyruvate tautomerase PptA (4-oxalocrotonate tautomerase family)
MPMIDIDLPDGVIPAAAHHQLAYDLGLALLAAESLPAEGAMLDGIGLYIHVLPADTVNTLATPGAKNVRVRATTAAGRLTRQGQRQFVAEATRLVALAGDDPTLAARTWVLHTETAEGGWGMSGRAFSGEDFDALDAGAAGR